MKASQAPVKFSYPSYLENIMFLFLRQLEIHGFGGFELLGIGSWWLFSAIAELGHSSNLRGPKLQICLKLRQ